jgi:ADP-ribosyl-[dinitrogen reductase] hydrolase
MKTPAVMVGEAVGDSLGMPFEHFSDGVHPDLAAWDGSFRPGTYHKLPAGHFTDDTEQAACLASSLVSQGCYDGEDVARRYLAWSRGTPHGMGGTTRTAMGRLAEGVSWRDSGVSFDSPDMVGSGPPMRSAPIGVFFTHFADIYAACNLDATITHASWEAVSASYAVAIATCFSRVTCGHGAELLEAVIERLEEVEKGRITKVAEDLRYALSFLKAGVAAKEIAPQPFSRRGNARSIVATALYCAAAADNFRDGVIAAVSLGGDTDTRGAITGAILGARFGLEGIPDEYKQGLLKFEELRQLDQRLIKGAAHK